MKRELQWIAGARTSGVFAAPATRAASSRRVWWYAVPAVIVRGVHVAGDGAAAELVMPPERDLFR